MATATLGEVCRYVREGNVRIELFGATAEFSKGYANFCQTLGGIIAAEQGITREEALKSKLSLDIKLGEKAFRKFLEFQSWVLESS